MFATSVVVFNQTTAPTLTITLDHQRYIMATPAAVLWKCCLCTAAPQLCATATKCTSCGHAMCKSCKKDKDIPPPMATGAFCSPPRTVSSMEPGDGRNCNRDRGKLHQPAQRLNLRPTAGGFWRCCTCTFTNNAILMKERCTGCGHPKCSRCGPWKPKRARRSFRTTCFKKWKRESLLKRTKFGGGGAEF